MIQSLLIFCATFSVKVFVQLQQRQKYRNSCCRVHIVNKRRMETYVIIFQAVNQYWFYGLSCGGPWCSRCWADLRLGLPACSVSAWWPLVLQKGLSLCLVSMEWSPLGCVEVLQDPAFSTELSGGVRFSSLGSWNSVGCAVCMQYISGHFSVLKAFSFPFSRAALPSLGYI